MDKQHLAAALFNFFEKEECEDLNIAFSQFLGNFEIGEEEEKEEREDLMDRCTNVASGMIRYMEQLKQEELKKHLHKFKTCSII